MKKFFLIDLVLIAFIFTGCEYRVTPFYEGNQVETHFNKITYLQDNADLVESSTAYNNFSKFLSGNTTESAYDVLIITDVHFGNRSYSTERIEPAFTEWLNALTESNLPKFALCLGDVADHGYNSEFKKYAALVDLIEAKGIKVLNVIGNHDYFNAGWSDWKSTCYPHTSFYKFETKGFSYYALDSGTGVLGKTQLNQLKYELNSEDKPCIFFTHYPLQVDSSLFFAMSDTTERNTLISLMEKQKSPTVLLSGHFHEGKFVTFKKSKQCSLKAYGQYGKWYTMTVDEAAPSIKFTEHSSGD